MNTLYILYSGILAHSVLSYSGLLCCFHILQGFSLSVVRLMIGLQPLPKRVPPHSANHCFLFQYPVSALFFNVIQQLLTSFSSSFPNLYPSLYISINNVFQEAVRKLETPIQLIFLRDYPRIISANLSVLRMQKDRVFAATLKFLYMLKCYKLATLLINGLNLCTF